MALTARTPSPELVDLVGALGGTWHGYTAMCRCPAHPDREPSLSIRQGDTGLLVTCFAGCEREDVLRELRRVRHRGSFPAPPAPVLNRSAANVGRLWSEGRAVAGTLAARYLGSRHLPATLTDLRYHPRCPHGPKPLTVFKPALLVAARDDTELTAIQRIFLDPVDARQQAKVMLGRPGAGAWRGGGTARTLAIAEGFESAAAFTILNGVPCWASLGARRLDLLAIPDQVETLLIAHDADAEGRRAAGRAESRYRRPERRILPAPPPDGLKDWADALRAHREREGGSRP